MSGEPVTAPVVHYDAVHLFTNTLALMCLGAIFERDRGAARLAMLVLTASLGCTLCVHLLVPSCSRFAGISGINYALIAFLLGRFLLQRPIITISCATLLCLYQLVLVNGEGRPVPVWQVHLGASFIGFIFWYITDGIRTVTAQSEPILLNPTGKDTQPCV